jgi:hypothetical protein
MFRRPRNCRVTLERMGHEWEGQRQEPGVRIQEPELVGRGQTDLSTSFRFASLRDRLVSPLGPRPLEFVPLWGSMSRCAPVGNRRSRRVANPPPVNNRPHMKATSPLGQRPSGLRRTNSRRLQGVHRLTQWLRRAPGPGIPSGRSELTSGTSECIVHLVSARMGHE